MSNTLPTAKLCPKCEMQTLHADYRKGTGPFLHCNSCGWDEELETRALMARVANAPVPEAMLPVTSEELEALTVALEILDEEYPDKIDPEVMSALVKKIATTAAPKPTPMPELPALPTNLLPDMTAVIGEILHDVAEAIEARIGGRRTMTGEGGPYEASLRIAYDKRLAEAAVAALEVIVSHPRLRPGR